jgi:ABC-type bacteriocin/lantibiotic exporter with double-glycine peptidase domain
MNTCPYECIYMFTCICIYIYMYKYVVIYIYLCMLYIYSYTCLYVYVYRFDMVTNSEIHILLKLKKFLSQTVSSIKESPDSGKQPNRFLQRIIYVFRYVYDNVSLCVCAFIHLKLHVYKYRNI